MAALIAERRIVVTYTMKGVFGTVSAVLHVLKDDDDDAIKKHLKQRVRAEMETIGITSDVESLTIWNIVDRSI